nr:hypothetical protein [Kibdelosporangium sp. MJ126-NF4]
MSSAVTAASRHVALMESPFVRVGPAPDSPDPPVPISRDRVIRGR